MNIPGKISLLLRNHAYTYLQNHDSTKGVNRDIAVRFNLKWNKSQTAQTTSYNKSAVFSNDASAVSSSSKGINSKLQVNIAVKEIVGDGSMSKRYDDYRVALLSGITELPFSASTIDTRLFSFGLVFADVKSVVCPEKIVLWYRVFYSLRNGLLANLSNHISYSSFDLLETYVFNYNIFALRCNLTEYESMLKLAPGPTKSFFNEEVWDLHELASIIISLNSIIDTQLERSDRMATLHFFGKEGQNVR